MGFRIQLTGEYIFTDFGLRNHFSGKLKVPNPLTVEWLEENGVDSVFEGPQATGGTVYQYSQFDGIEKDSQGRWFTKYILGPIFTDLPANGIKPAQTAAEQEIAYKAMKDEEQGKSIRSTRTNMLKECDWTQISDATVDKAAWATYRQALRDVTVQAGFPWTIEWPTEPV